MNTLDRFFKISERGSSVQREVVGGLTTFLAMAYIIAVNPQLMVHAGMSFTAALTATCFGAAIMTLAMGLIANRPLALASGMGINSIVAFTLCAGQNAVDWRVAMAVVLLEGTVILILVLCGLREAIMDAIPASLRHAIGIGIGLFISFMGLKNGGLIVANESTILGFGEITSPVCIVSLVAIAVAVCLRARKVPGDLFISIIVATIVGIPLGVTPMPGNMNFGLDFSAFAAPLQTDPTTNTLALARVFLEPTLLLMVFSLLMSDFFDTIGTVVAVGQQGDFADKDGNVKDISKILTVDSVAAMVGGFLGASSLTTFVESASGAAAGARTGFANVITAIAFAVFAFFAPIIGMVSGSATCGALTVVGYLMLSDAVNIDWNKLEMAFPAFMIIAGIPFTYSITNGIGLGFISYCLIMVAKGEAKKVSPLMWGATAAFVAMFLLM
jgi:AGZA family xanthine/uracil permease-like MFS transporter